MDVSKSDLGSLTATQAVELMRWNHVSARDYARALLDRIRERDPQVRAWIYLNEEAVLEQADNLDRIPPEKRGPLHGVAVGIKDVFLTQGTHPSMHMLPSASKGGQRSLFHVVVWDEIIRQLPAVS